MFLLASSSSDDDDDDDRHSINSTAGDDRRETSINLSGVRQHVKHYIITVGNWAADAIA